MATRRVSISGFMIFGVAIVIAVGSLVIIAGSLLYSNHLVKNLANQELSRVENYGDVLAYVANADPACETSSIFDDFIKANQSIPTVLVDGELNIIDSRNVTTNPDSLEAIAEVEQFLEKIQKQGGDRVEVDLGYDMFNYVYYDESTHLKQLRLFPYLQLVVIGIFMLVIFVGFSVAKRNEQNKVWVGLAKETAHQLGTPVSSLMAWVELLKLKVNKEDLELIDELQKDVSRLEMITERFSKIGSQPELKPTSFNDVLVGVSEYMKKRMPRRVKLIITNDLPLDTMVNMNRPLFEWVIENLWKNALDAIEGATGSVSITVTHTLKNIYVEVADTGKGIPGHLQKRIFKPGFTTKKRGWGLGLSLTRRIVENYHNGKIFVKESTVGKGTVFRIILPKND